MRTTKMWHRNTEQALLEKWCQKTCSVQGGPEPFNLFKKKAVSAKYIKVNHNKA